MDTAAVGITEEENQQQRIDQQDIFYRVVFFLAAITRGLFNRVLGADDPPFRAIMGKRGDTGATAGTAPSGRWVFHQRRDRGRRISLRDSKPLGEGGQGASR